MKLILFLFLLTITNSALALSKTDLDDLLSQFFLNQESELNKNESPNRNLSFTRISKLGTGTSTISGTITESTLAPVENYLIKLIKVENGSYFEVSDALTNEFGAYEFSSLLEGKYVVFSGTTTDEYLDYLWKPANVGGPVLCSGCVKQVDSQFDLLVGESKSVDLVIEKGGVISGNATDALLQVVSLTSLAVILYSENNDYQVRAIEDNTAGTYIFKGVPNGNYKVYLTSQVTNESLFNEYIPQIYEGGECVSCIDKVKQGFGENLIISNLGTITDINFVLRKGASIEGIVVDENTLEPDYSVAIVVLVNEAGDAVSFAGILGFWSNEGGAYKIGGLLPGRYYVYTYTTVTASFNSITPFQRMLFANKPCPYKNCDFTKADVIEITGNETISDIDFLLKLGGLIKGTVIDSATGNPPIMDGDLFVEVYDADENVVGGSRISPNTGGEYTTGGIAEGVYSVKIGNTRTGESAKPYIEEKFDNIECVGLACDLSTGNVNVVTDQQTFDIDFSLDKGYSISGNIIDFGLAVGIGNINLILYKSLENGNNIKYASFTKSRNIELDELGNVALIGSYQFSGLPEGDYYLVTNNGSNLPFGQDNPEIHGLWIDKLYGDVLCPGSTCDISQGTIITVNAANPSVSDININLTEGAIISGRVFDINKQIVEGININLFNATGNIIGQFKTDSNGIYQTTGLITGSYYLTTSSHVLWRDVKYGDDLCDLSCDPLQGDVINLSNQQQLNNIDFHLTRIDGDIFINGFE
jgi:hypothetical protein